MPGPLEAALARPDVRDAAAALRHWAAPRRHDDRRVHRHLRDGRVGPARPSARHDHVVAGAAVPAAVSRASLLDESSMIVQVGRVRDRRRGAEPHRSRAVAGARGQSAARVAHREVSHRRFAAVAVRLRADRPPRPLRPDRAALRRVGACDGWPRVFARRRRHGPSGRASGRSRAACRACSGSRRWSYFQSLRVERAVHLLKTSGASVDDVAARVGYARRRDAASAAAAPAQAGHQGNSTQLALISAVLSGQSTVAF